MCATYNCFKRCVFEYQLQIYKSEIEAIPDVQFKTNYFKPSGKGRCIVSFATRRILFETIK